MEQTLVGVFKAFLRMVELKHATMQEVLTLFTPSDFQTQTWEHHTSQVVIEESSVSHTATVTEVHTKEVKTQVTRKTKEIIHEEEQEIIEETEKSKGETRRRVQQKHPKMEEVTITEITEEDKDLLPDDKTSRVTVEHPDDSEKKEVEEIKEVVIKEEKKMRKGAQLEKKVKKKSEEEIEVVIEEEIENRRKKKILKAKTPVENEETVIEEITEILSVEPAKQFKGLPLKTPSQVSETTPETTVSLIGDVSATGVQGNLSVITFTAIEQNEVQGVEKEDDRPESLSPAAGKAKPDIDTVEPYIVSQPQVESVAEEFSKTFKPTTREAIKVIMENEGLVVTETRVNHSVKDTDSFKTEENQATMSVSLHEAKYISETLPSVKEGDFQQIKKPVQVTAAPGLTLQESISVTEITQSIKEEKLEDFTMQNTVKPKFNIQETDSLIVSEVLAETKPSKYFPELFVPTESATPSIVAEKATAFTEEINLPEKEGEYQPGRLPLGQLAGVQVLSEDSVVISEPNVHEKEGFFSPRQKPSESVATTDVNVFESVEVSVVQHQDTEGILELVKPETKMADVQFMEKKSIFTQETNISESEAIFKSDEIPSVKKAHPSVTCLETHGVSETITNEGIEDYNPVKSIPKAKAELALQIVEPISVSEVQPEDKPTELSDVLKYCAIAASSKFEILESKEISQVQAQESEKPLINLDMPAPVSVSKTFVSKEGISVYQTDMIEKEGVYTPFIIPESHTGKAIPTQPLQSVIVEEITPENEVGNISKTLPLSAQAKLKHTPFQETVVEETVVGEAVMKQKESMKPEGKRAEVNILEEQSVSVTEVITDYKETSYTKSDSPQECFASQTHLPQKVALKSEVIPEQTTSPLQQKAPTSNIAKSKQMSFESLMVSSIEVVESEAEFKKEISPVKSKASVEMTEYYTGLNVEEIVSSEKEFEHTPEEKPIESKASKSILPHHTALYSQTLPDINLGSVPSIEFPTGHAKVDSNPFQEVLVTETNITETETTLDTIKPELRTATVGIRSGESFLVSEVVAEDKEDVFKSGQLPESRKAILNLTGQEVAEHEEVVELFQEGTWSRESPVKEQATRKQDTIQLAVASQQVPSELEGRLEAPIKPSEKVASVLFVEGLTATSKPSQPATLVLPSTTETSLEETNVLPSQPAKGEVGKVEDVPQLLNEANVTVSEVLEPSQNTDKKKKPTRKKLEINKEKGDKTSNQMKEEEKELEDKKEKKQDVVEQKVSIVPEKLKLKKEKIEIKEVKPQKVKIEEKKDETPLFATIKLRKTSIAEKKEAKPATQVPKVLLKSLIKHVQYPPQMQMITITEINAVVDCGILSRNFEEALKIKKKKLKKVKLPEVEKVELEKYVPYTIEKEEQPQKQAAILEDFKTKPDSQEQPLNEPVVIKIGKGKIPVKEEVLDVVTLKKITPKPTVDKESIVDSPKTLKPQDKPEELEDEDEEIKLKPLEPFDSGEPTADEERDQGPEKEKLADKTEPPTFKPTKEKLKTPKETPGQKKLVLGKPKDKPEKLEEDISFHYKQKELPKPEPDSITLKPFEKDSPPEEGVTKDLSVQKPVYPDQDNKTEEIVPKEFEHKDKPKKKLKKKTPSPDLQYQEDSEDKPTIEEVPKEKSILEDIPITILEEPKPKEQKEKEKPKLMKIERIEHQATKLQVEEAKPEEVFSTKKLRKPSIVPKKEPKPVEVQKVLLKSLIKKIPFPPEEQIPTVTVLEKVDIEKGILSRSYEEAIKIKKPKQRKVKLPEPEKTDLEVYEPGPDYLPRKNEPEIVDVTTPKERCTIPSTLEEQPKLKMGKGTVPVEGVEDETVVLKRVPDKIVDKKGDDIAQTENRPDEKIVPKVKTDIEEVSLEPFQSFDIPRPTREIESPDKLEQEVNVKSRLPSKKQKEIPETGIDDTIVLKKKPKDTLPVKTVEDITLVKEEVSPKIQPEEEIVQKFSLKKKKITRETSPEIVSEEITLKTKKSGITQQVGTSEQIVVKEPKKPYEDEDVSETITISNEKPTNILSEDVISEDFTIKKTKPVLKEQEEISEEFVIQSKRPSIVPMKTDDVEEQLVLKKKKKPKTAVFEEEAEQLTLTQEAPITIEKPTYEDTERMVLVLKKSEKPAEEPDQITIVPRRRSSVRKPSIEEHPEEKITLKQRRSSEDLVVEEVVTDITFKPKVTKPKEEIEQEFKISLQTYEEEDISMSGKVRLPRKKKIQPVSDEASAEMTIQKQVEIDEGQDVNVPLRRKSVTKPYSIEDVEVQLGFRQQQHRASIVYEEESLDIKVKRKPSKPSIPAFSQESAGLTITREEDVFVEKGEKIVETAEGDVLFSICSYVAENDEALNLVEGERVYVLENTSQDWWFVQKNLTEEKGWVPAVYLRDEPSYTLYVQKKLHEKIDKLPIFEKPTAGEEVYAPRFVEKLQPRHVPDGATVQFECQVEGNPRPQITWFRQTAIVKPSQDFQIFYDDDNVATLIIREVFPEDAGTFTCVAKNAAGFASSTTELIVEAPLSDHGSDITGLSRKSLSRESSLADILEGIPPTFSRKPKAKIVKEGDSVELECRLVAVPEPEISWSYQGKPITPSDSVTVTTQSDMHMYSTMVTITNVKKSQEGVYQVLAKNREGQATLDIILKVKTGQPEPPEIVEPLQDVCISEGESAILVTQITGKPTPKIVWSRDGKPDPTLPAKVQGETYSLTLIKPSPSDSARYTVIATNKHGTTQTSCQLTVEGVPGPQAPLFVERFEEQNVKEKGTIRLAAKVTGNPVPMVTWFRNNKTLLASPKQTQMFDGENIMLEIKDADSEEDAGDYKCVASNNVGTATHGARVTIDVEKVSFTKLLQERVELNETETVTLECETSHTVSTKWKHNGVDLSGMDHRELVQEGRSHRLIIKRATLRDTGTYTCSVKDQLTSCSVTVHETKPDFVRKLEDFEVKEQEVAILEVEITSETADVTWIKDGLPIEPIPGKLEVEKKGNIRKLLIRSSSVHDEGEYTCTIGDQECSAEVTVIELPPQILTKMQDVTVTEGERATLEVELTKGDALVRWFKDDKELHFSEHVQLSIDGKKQKLKIYQAEPSDAGTYSCRVGDQPDQVSTANVTVEEPAVQFITKLPDVTLVPENTDAEFTVELSQPIEVKWLKKGKEIKPSNKFIIKSEGNVHTLIIKKATTEDQTDITCAAANVKTSSKLKVEKIEIAPKIKIDATPKEYKVKKGEDVNIEVKFTASPPPTDEWTVNGTVIKKNKRVDYTLGEESACLTIKKVEEVDVGSYTLRLKNSVGEASAEMTLIIMQEPGEPGTPDVLEVTDDSVTLHWKPPAKDGNSPITRYIVEYHDKEEFREWHEVQETITVTTHKVMKMTHDAEIMFRVSAENEVGRGPHSDPTKYVRITAPVESEPPVIQEPLQDCTVGLGQSITLQCVVGGIPLPEVKWFRHGKPFKTRKMTYENRVAKFPLPDCKEDAAGTYSLVATNSAGTAETSCTLLVQDVPTLEVSEAVRDQILTNAAQWKPEVSFTGFPRPEIIWEKNNQVMTSDTRCKIFIDEKATTLAIYSVDRSDEATYMVRAANVAGSACAELTLKVIDKPGKPEGPITFSNITANTITIDWKPPLDTGGLKLSKYILEKCEASKLIWTKAADVEGHSTTCTLTKLVENTEYMFRVYAQNAVGTSEALTSESVLVRTYYNKPSPPQGPLEATGMTETSCTISWKPPADDGGTPVLDYTVQRKEASKKSWQTLGTTTEPTLAMTDLKLNSAYTFRITARNMEGESEPYISEDPIIAGRKITPPSAPLNFNAVEITSKSVTLQWSPPASTGGTEVTGYIIEKQYGDSNKWSKVVTLDPGHLQYTVENLKEKSELYFRIYAENSVGLSTAAGTSIVSLKTHATVPSPPTDPLEMRSLGPNSIIVEWGVPETDGGAPLEGYKIAIRDTKKTMWIEVGQVAADVQKLTIKDLQENHEYLVRIFARNEVGLSEPLESDEPFLVKKPTGMEEIDVEERSLLEKDTPSLSLTTETTTSWMREAGMDADIQSYAKGSLLRRSEYFFRIWYYAKHLFK